ncbi:YxeF family protein [Bacillus spizizenii]|uniref:YxeF family protein n=1 Tax=Bacillus spizizenii TaxID=96241 RepID=A0A9Q4EAI8_BACSC|nr:YxeF family protein [Bacillus spizizenii]MCY8458914.1 YxeF family protein [Bacillus spizizenii]
MVIFLRNKCGILLLAAVCIMLSGCQQQKEETPFYYGTWDEGIAQGPMDGVKSATVTFTKDEVMETEVIEGRGEIQLPFMAYKVISQSTDGSIGIQYLGPYYPLKSTLKRGENGTLIWEQNGQTKTMTRIKSKTGKEEKYEK